MSKHTIALLNHDQWLSISVFAYVACPSCDVQSIVSHFNEAITFWLHQFMAVAVILFWGKDTISPLSFTYNVENQQWQMSVVEIRQTAIKWQRGIGFHSMAAMKVAAMAGVHQKRKETWVGRITPPEHMHNGSLVTTVMFLLFYILLFLVASPLLLSILSSCPLTNFTSKNYHPTMTPTMWRPPPLCEALIFFPYSVFI